jgi:hypothetical protein
LSEGARDSQENEDEKSKCRHGKVSRTRAAFHEMLPNCE